MKRSSSPVSVTSAGTMDSKASTSTTSGKRRRIEDSTGKSITSLKVFMSFVKVDPVTNKVDATEVFSMKCFNFWLNTRPNEIKHPQQSFQRALYAHIRGADGRKPFPEYVERELLKILRQDEYNPWTKMFGENVFKLGKKGFKRTGFHEGKFREQLSQREQQVSAPFGNFAVPNLAMNQFMNKLNFPTQLNLMKTSAVTPQLPTTLPYQCLPSTIPTFPSFSTQVNNQNLLLQLQMQEQLLRNTLSSPSFPALHTLPSTKLVKTGDALDITNLTTSPLTTLASLAHFMRPTA